MRRKPRNAYNRRRQFDTYDEDLDGVEWEQWMIGSSDQQQDSKRGRRMSVGRT